MLWIIIALAVLTIIAVYFAIPGGKLWKQYLKDIKTSLADTDRQDNEQRMFTADAIAELSALLQQHIAYGGYMEKPLVSNMMICFFDWPNCRNPATCQRQCA